MTVWVLKNNVFVVKRKVGTDFRGDFTQFPTPAISRLEPYESPITGQQITSWRERERELTANGCYDPRDRPGPYARGRTMKEAEHGREQRRSDPGFQWTDPA